LNYRKRNSLVSAPRRNRQSSFQNPEVVSSDDIAVLSDEDLMSTIATVDETRKKVNAEKCDTRLWEEELCYLRREAQIRRKRHAIHEKYLLELDRENREAQDVERSLPSADFDNSVFML
jgi:hypothetical protein